MLNEGIATDVQARIIVVPSCWHGRSWPRARHTTSAHTQYCLTYKPEEWARRTHKLYDDRWQAPPDAKLALEVRSAKSNKMVVGIDEFAAEIALQGGQQWQNVRLSPTDFQDVEGKSLPNWDDVKQLRLGAKETLRAKGMGVRQSRVLGASWQGLEPEFRNLRWIGGAKINQ